MTDSLKFLRHYRTTLERHQETIQQHHTALGLHSRHNGKDKDRGEIKAIVQQFSERYSLGDRPWQPQKPVDSTPKKLTSRVVAPAKIVAALWRDNYLAMLTIASILLWL